MSLKSLPMPPVPEEMARIAHAVFPHGNVFMQVRDTLGTIYTDETFADLFPTHGQPASAPWRLALVSVFQFMENLTDRQAADVLWRTARTRTLARSEEQERKAYANQVGADGWMLLDALEAPATPDWMKTLPAITTLRTMWEQQFEAREQGGRWRQEPALPAAQLLNSPYEPFRAQWEEEGHRLARL